jgi:hypothetical protein
MIIGLVGFAGSGKGTVADILCEKYGFTKVSFADVVKDITAQMFGWDRHLLEGDTDESRAFRESQDDWWTARLGKPITPRNMLQLMGTEAGRDTFDQNIWIHNVERKIHNMRVNEFKERFVIADTRFPNEIEAIRNWGGHVVRVMRGKEPKWFETAAIANITKDHSLMKSKYHNIHYSEWAWIGERFNYLITNDSSKIMLDADVNHLVKVFTGPVNTDILTKVA